MAVRALGLLLQRLKHSPATWGLHNPLLIALGVIALVQIKVKMLQMPRAKDQRQKKQIESHGPAFRFMSFHNCQDFSCGIRVVSMTFYIFLPSQGTKNASKNCMLLYPTRKIQKAIVSTSMHFTIFHFIRIRILQSIIMCVTSISNTLFHQGAALSSIGEAESHGEANSDLQPRVTLSLWKWHMAMRFSA